MAIYTTTISTILKNNTDIKLHTYPIFDEKYRQVLNNNIINYYYNYEIGFETVGLFNFELENTMNLIMPIYNKMYIAVNKDFDIFSNYDLTDKYNREYEGNMEGETSNKGLSLYSDTPQGNISENEITSLEYLTTADQAKSLGESKSKSTGKEGYIKNTSGTQGIPKYEMIKKYIESLKNIDYQIIKELKPLFMGVW